MLLRTQDLTPREIFTSKIRRHSPQQGVRPRSPERQSETPDLYEIPTGPTLSS